MEENKIPTAEEFLNNFRFEAGEMIGNRDFDTMALYAKEFAKLHVEAALKAASENATTMTLEEGFLDTVKGIWVKYPKKYIVNKDSILNSYPLENIKM